MKKLLLLFVIVLTIILNTTYAFAATHKLDELNIEVSFPDDWVVYTRNTPVDDPLFDLLNINGTDLLNHMNSNSIYLNSILPEYTREILFTMTTNEATQKAVNLNGVSDNDLQELSKSLLAEIRSAYSELVFQNSNIYNTNNTNYIVLEYWRPYESYKIYSQQYSTIQNGQCINITFHSYVEQMTLSNANDLKNVVDSISWTKNLPRSSAEKQGIFSSDLWFKALGAGVTSLIVGGGAVLFTKIKQKIQESNQK